MNFAPKANVLGIGVDAIDMEGAIARLSDSLRQGEKGYVCLVGVHGIMEAQRDRAVAHAFADASLVAPDGMPTVWVGRLQGYEAMRQVTGPDLMLEVMCRPEFRGCSHFLYGGKPGVAHELQQELAARWPDLRIVGSYTPPFGPLSTTEEADLIRRVNELRPDIIWVGISTPRQEQFMERYLPHFNTKLMFGVGAAFDFHTGRISDCAPWIKNCGMQWFHRLLQDPRRLWKRYLRNNPAFLFAIALQFLHLRRYELDGTRPVEAGCQLLTHPPKSIAFPASE